MVAAGASVFDNPQPGPDGSYHFTPDQWQIVIGKAKERHWKEFTDTKTAIKLAEELAARAAKVLANEAEAEQEEAARIAAGEPTGWEQVDLSPYLDGTYVEPVPSVLLVRMPDGWPDRYVLYVGVNWMFGESGEGKSMCATEATAQVLLGGGVVVWIDYEEATAVTLCGRLTDMGVPADVVLAGLEFRHPQTKAQEKHIDLLVEQAVATAEERGCGRECVRLVVIDSVGEAFGVESINENNDVEVAPWVNRVLRRIARKLPDAAILPVDHTTKSKEYRLHPSGSKRKRAAVNGVMVLVEVETEFSRSKAGASRLICAKDRHGNYTRGAEIGLMTVNGTVAGTLAVDLHERTEGEAKIPDGPPKSKFEERVEAVIAAATSAGPVEGMLASDAFAKAWAIRQSLGKETTNVPTADMRSAIVRALKTDAHPYVFVTGATSTQRITVKISAAEQESE